MPLTMRIASLICLVLALFRVRPAYAAFVALAVLSFPARAGFALTAPACELLVDWQLALFSLRNHAHTILFGLFFLLTRHQLDGANAGRWAFVGTIAMGALVEVAEGVSGQGHCRLRDLLPDAMGATVAWLGVTLALRLRAQRAGRAHAAA